MKERILTMIKKALLMSTFFSLSLLSVSYAGQIEVINKNKKPLKVKIEAEGDKMKETLSSHIQEIPAKESFMFNVEPEHLGGKTSYSIKGDTNPFTPGDSCNKLDVKNDYRVTFTNDTIGTSCIAEKIEKVVDKDASKEK